MYFAEIDKNGRCFHVTTTELTESDTVVKTDEADVLGKIWDGEEWKENTEPTPEPELTKTEQAILETAVNVDYLVCLQEMEF